MAEDHSLKASGEAALMAFLYYLTMSEKQIVEAFRSFFDKSVLPFVSHSDAVMREWTFLSKIITSEPIDYGQVEFYLLMATKGGAGLSLPQGSQPQIASTSRIGEEGRFRKNDYGGASNDRLNVSQQQEKKSSQIGRNTNKR
jgi:hypothetical protein